MLRMYRKDSTLWRTAYPRAVAALALLIALSIMLPVGASAGEIGTIRNPNGGSYVNVRAWPGYDADILTRLSVGTAVELTGSSGTWYSVWVDGVVGYIHSNFVSVTGSSGEGGGTGPSATVISGPLNVREAPSMRARVITQLPTGLRVTVLSEDGTWSQIQAAQIVGYVVTNYLSIDSVSPPAPPNPPIITPDANATVRTTNGGNLNLRAYASSSAEVLGSFPNGSRVRVLTQGASWYRVQAGNSTGYMSARYVIMDATGGSTDGYDAVVDNPSAGQVLNLREQPSTSSTALAQYHNGTQLKVLGVGTEWHRVSVGGKTGYMMAKYVRILSSGATPHHTVEGGAGGFVNLRSGPGYGYSVLKRLSNGAAASVVIPYTTWSEVLVREGSGFMRGYILNSFLR